MTREVNCMNCMVGRFKDDLCNEKMCKTLKTIGKSDDVANILMLAKEIIQCKDCRHWYEKMNKCNRCPSISGNWGANDFCSYGERRKGK